MVYMHMLYVYKYKWEHASFRTRRFIGSAMYRERENRIDNEHLRDMRLPIYLRFPMALHKMGKVNLGFELAIAGNQSR